MIVFAWYLLKVIIVSAILCGYYYIALKDKIFHRWNRFYLLFTIVLSLLLPFISIDIFQPASEQGAVIKVLQAVTVQDEIVIELGKKNLLTTDTLIIAGYTLISLVFIATLLLTLIRIYRIKKRYPSTEVEGINFINTDAEGTPFSFFNSIFWNRSIDLHSTAGQQIFNHEIAHVKEKHTYDKIFTNLVLLFFWINPFFWLIRKELNMIHEFIADKMALEDGDINAFAEMILSSVYPGQQFSITNNFFYSPIKRRLKMLTKNKNSKVNYVSRLLVLPLAAVVFMAFALKMKTVKPAQIYTGEPITVIIDAGHGGSDNGAISQDIKEKDLTLAIAKEIKDLNTNKNINIILSRDHDQNISVKDRVNFAIKKNADLFVSIHINSQMGGKSANGLNVVIPKEDNAYLSPSKLLGSSIVQSFKNNFPLKVSDKLVQLNMGLWILKANQFPAVLIHAGYLTSQKDLPYLSQSPNQQTIARNILNGIENYAQNRINQVSIITDTIPEMYYQNKKVTGISVRPQKNNIKVTYNDGSTEIISKEEADKRGFILPPPPPPLSPNAPKAPLPPTAPTPPSPPSLGEFPETALYILNGKEVDKATISKISPENIATINVLKGEKSANRFGKKGQNGVIEITTKNSANQIKEDDIIKVKAESIFIHDPLKLNHSSAHPLILLNGKEILYSEMKQIPPDQIASISIYKDSQAELKYGEKGKDGVVEIYTKGAANNKTNNGNRLIEKHISTTFNGTTHRKVTNKTQRYIGSNGKNYTSKSVIIKIQTDTIPEKILTQVEEEAQFPGGQQAWVKYVTRQIMAVQDTFTEKDFGTCIVKFIVDKNGNVSDVAATTMKGTNLARVSVDAIRKGPKWIPAMQNGRKVNAYRLQPVTLYDPDHK